jgi:hypothetical protein
MRFRTGKYAGMTLEHVRKIAPWYIQWVRENRPEMLKDRSPSRPKAPPKRIEPPEDDGKYKIQPNLDFESEYKPSAEQAFGMNFPNTENE